MSRQRLITMVASVLLIIWGEPALAKPEPWYMYLGVGYSSPSYSGEIDETVVRTSNTPGSSHSAGIFTDFLGFYWPVPRLSERTILGFVCNLSLETYQQGGEEVTIGAGQFGPSIMHFFGPEPGAGVFFRTDIGIVRLTVDKYLDDSNQSIELHDKKGLGVLIGSGYGLPVGVGTRLMLDANYTLQFFGGDTARAFEVGLGLLW